MKKKGKKEMRKSSKLKLDSTLDIFDKFLDQINYSPISNEDYQSLQNIFDKYLEQLNRKE
tara:strand:+ start:352 stop:531 length:180 start_codon:yes stop_codon:yes gene_type:complete